MKPILLEIEAFGPYSDLQVIDFRLLKDINMFLIHGPTGGGKTTILDAISYVLYGDTSGNERDGESMRSHFAKKEVLTQVKFEFKVRDSTYYIHRTPGQERPKKVGEGTTYQNPKAELYEIKSDNSKELIATGVNKVGEEVVNIIGFDSDQFRQVIMIPQGQFRELLTAKSEQRQKILGDIFQTNKYKRVEDKIRAENKKLRDEIVTLGSRRDEQIKSIKSEGSKPLEQLIDAEFIDPQQVLDDINILFGKQNEILKDTQENIGLSDKQIEENNKEYNKAKINQANQDEKLKAKKEYQTLKAKQDYYKELEKSNELSQKAIPIKEVEIYMVDISRQEENAKKELKQVEEVILKLDEEYSKLESQIENLKKQDPEIEKLKSKVYKYENDYLPKINNLQKLLETNAILNKQMDKDDKSMNNLKKDLEKTTKTNVLYKKEIQEKDKKTNDLNDIKLKSEKIKNIITNKKEQIQINAQLKHLLANHKKVQLEIKKLTKEYNESNKEHTQALNRWVASQTSELSKELKEGEPCPVCGSTTHPSPAQETETSVTQADVTSKKEKSDKIHEKLISLQTKKTKIETEGKSCRSNLERIEKILEIYNKTTLEDLLKEQKDNNEKQINLEKELKIIKKLEESLENLDSEKEKIDNNIKEIERKIIRNKEKHKLTLKEIEKVKTEVPKEIQNISSLNASISDLNKTLLDNKNENDLVKDKYQNAVKEIQKQRGIKEEKTTQSKQMKINYNKAVSSFELRVDEAGFKNTKEYKGAYKNQEEIQKIEKETKEYNNKLNIIKSQYEKLEKETKDIILKDIVKLEQAHNKEKQLNINLRKKYQEIEMQKQHNEKQQDIIMKYTEEIQTKEKRYSIIGNLYDAVRGKNSKGLSFERFVQSALFDDILIRANERLVIMSNNRYELYRSHNRESKAAQSGLEMEVLDTYTGKMRHVNTLSGGEGFMASLSLALGLADVVQSYAGGIALDTMFIDEGFGTLDAQSLDLAINTLVDLQKSGRLVGIISHVPELKERIGTRLEIMNSQRGSSVKFHI